MTNQTTADMLAEFHAALGQPFGHCDLTDTGLRQALHEEEHDELLDAFEDARDAEEAGKLDEQHLESVAKELADVVYVAYGTAHVLGIPLDAVLVAVHRSNMTKFDEYGRPILRADGKLLRSARYEPANVASALRQAGQSAAWPDHTDGCDEGDEEGPGRCDPACPQQVLARAKRAERVEKAARGLLIDLTMQPETIAVGIRDLQRALDGDV